MLFLLCVLCATIKNPPPKKHFIPHLVFAPQNASGIVTLLQNLKMIQKSFKKSEAQGSELWHYFLYKDTN